MHRSKRGSHDSVQTPIASLIDVVFLLIIFFVVTSSIDKEVVDESIRLADAEYTKPATESDPREVIINLKYNSVTKLASYNLGMVKVTKSELSRILKSVREQSDESVPVIIRTDKDAKFKNIKELMEIIADAGLRRIKLAAIVDE